MSIRIVAQRHLIYRCAPELLLLAVGTLALSSLSTAYAKSHEPPDSVQTLATTDAMILKTGAIELFPSGTADISAPELMNGSPSLQLDLVDRVNRMFREVFEASVYGEDQIHIELNAAIHDPDVNSPMLTNNVGATSMIQAGAPLPESASLPGRVPAGVELAQDNEPGALYFQEQMFRTDI